MLRILLHFSEHDATTSRSPRRDHRDPRKRSWEDVIAAFAEHGHSRLPVYGETLDEVVGMVLIKDVFPIPRQARRPRTGPPCCASRCSCRRRAARSTCWPTCALAAPTSPL
jgi:CBS domain containing-hemolysin-like protein